MNQKKSAFFFVLAVLVVLIGTMVQFKKSERSTNNDFRVYYKTSERIQNGEWADIYTRKDGPFPYRYVPYTLPAFTWMSHFSEPVSRKIWVVMQFLCFIAGYYYLYKSLVMTGSRHALLAVSLSALLTFRQYLDVLYSGQVAGLVFVSFSLGLYFFLKGKKIQDGVVLSLAASLKIFPGFNLIHGLIKCSDNKQRLKFLAAGLGLFLLLNVFCWLWLGLYNQQHLFFELWVNWKSIVLATGDYFDGSTPKSQSLRAFILRTLGKKESSETIWKILFLSCLAGLVFHWIRGTSKNLLHNAYSYCLGIMAFILFMPETLPYQLVNVAIPFAFIMSDEKIKTDRFFQFTFMAFAAFISFASADLLGRSFSDWLQAQSFAFFVLCLVSFILIRETRSKDQVVRT